LNEKWFKDRYGLWHVIQPNGAVSRWNGVNLAQVLAVDPSVWRDPNLLFLA
jgi:hypothetical protein